MWVGGQSAMSDEDFPKSVDVIAAHSHAKGISNSVFVGWVFPFWKDAILEE
tara:strand:- start:6032 stop:6184 length:153 start_codon:yes stop_codon:yes gene_type:complete